MLQLYLLGTFYLLEEPETEGRQERAQKRPWRRRAHDPLAFLVIATLHPAKAAL